MNRDDGIAIQIAHKVEPPPCPKAWQASQNAFRTSVRNLMGRDQVAARQPAAGVLGGLVPLVLAIG